MSAYDEYLRWSQYPQMEKSLKDELESVKDHEKEIEDRFYRDLEFGTAGLRGILGAGTNRMNIYTVRRAARALGLSVLKQDQDAAQKGIVIAYDSRIGSYEFAHDSAAVLAKLGIKAYIFDTLRPTPELSFAIRYLGTASGIVVTASHNPYNYNGFKAYGSDGAQINPETANLVLSEMAQIDPLNVDMMDYQEGINKGLIVEINESVDRAYISHVLSLRPDPDLLERTGIKLNVVYTPLHGAGNVPVRRALKEAGYDMVTVVKEQELPDGMFPTVKSPNPENTDAFAAAMPYAEANNADIIVATDPDSDRMAVMVNTGKGYQLLTGNQIGCIMLDYIASAKKDLRPEDYAVTSVVSTRMVDKIAAYYNVNLYRVLTGFKFIGETIDRQEQNGNKGFLLGFEESYGFLTGGYIRDKDAVIASLTICEIAASLKLKGLTLVDRLNAMYEKFGYFKEGLLSITLPGIDGVKKREAAMAKLRNDPVQTVAGRKITKTVDYLKGVDGLPKSDVMMYTIEGGAWLCVRPSGTEPKLKIYAGVCEDSEAKAEQEVEKLIAEFKKNIAQ